MSTSNLEQCYLCPGYLNRSEAGNYKGHFAHPDCIARALAAGTSEPVSGPPGVEGPPGFQTLLPESGGLYHVCESTDPDKLAVVMELPAELIKDGPNAAEIVKECHAVMQLLLTKNRAYGSSFAQPMGVFSKLSPVDAINARMDDKLARVKQAKDYSEDTEADLIGYLILKRIALRMEQASCDAHRKAHGCPALRNIAGDTLGEILEDRLKEPHTPISEMKIPNKAISGAPSCCDGPMRPKILGIPGLFGTQRNGWECPFCARIVDEYGYDSTKNRPVTSGGSATPAAESASPLTPDQPGPPPASSPAAPASGPPAVQ